MARFADEVPLQRGAPLPDVCSCCLGATEGGREEVGGSRGPRVLTTHVPKCGPCQKTTKLYGFLVTVSMVAGFALAVGIRFAFVPKADHNSFAVMLFAMLGGGLALGLIGVFFLRRAFSKPGHAPGCKAVTLKAKSMRLGGAAALVCKNRAFAKLVTGPASPDQT